MFYYDEIKALIAQQKVSPYWPSDNTTNIKNPTRENMNSDNSVTTRNTNDIPLFPVLQLPSVKSDSGVSLISLVAFSLLKFNGFSLGS